MSRLALQDVPKAKPGPKPDPERVRSAVTNVRSRPEWKEWLEGVAEILDVPVAEVIDRALILLAREDSRLRPLGIPPKR